MHLPFGDLMLGAGPRKGGFLDLISDVSNSKQAEVASNESLEYVKAEEPSSEVQNKDQQNGDANFCCWKLYDATEMLIAMLIMKKRIKALNNQNLQGINFKKKRMI
ncbi:uncharacterized protein LOC121785919 [Salvia splendens]|uniref:uncharacterized protein LOC121785919 n=1 Tax=Salvia splendens TaxID=180675 RepID=UPI001C2802DB|nr:uncharacterized protein LOC121785919 [Salvia splendens]